jgi:hypothetical protein
MIKHLSTETLSTKALTRNAPFGFSSGYEYIGIWIYALRHSVFVRVMSISVYMYMSISIYPFSVIIRVVRADRNADHITILTYSNVIKRPLLALLA